MFSLIQDFAATKEKLLFHKRQIITYMLYNACAILIIFLNSGKLTFFTFYVILQKYSKYG